MPDKRDDVQESGKKRQFIREKVAKPPMTKKQMAGRLLMCLLIALVGGVSAGTAFAVAGPLAERYLTPTTAEETIPVKIPTDADLTAESETSVPDASAEKSTEAESESETETETEPLEDILQSAIEEYQYTVDDFNSMYQSLRNVAQTADRGIVIIHSVQEGLDWFDNPVETAGLYAGAVIAATEKEMLILTPAAAIEGADSLRVTFYDNTETDGAVRQVDRLAGIAVVSVDVGTLEDSTREHVTPLPLGNSFLTRQGEAVIAVGAPSGVVHSSAYGTISYVLRNVQVEDGAARLLYADVTGSVESGTFLINTAGELIGWITDRFQSGSGMTVAMGISDYKTNLEKLSNGIAVPYLGIRGQEVNAAMQEDGMPEGFYVAECIMDGPAYNAGIQNGDIITRIGENELSASSGYQGQVSSLNAGDEVTIAVQRRGADEYIELEYQVVVGAR